MSKKVCLLVDSLSGGGAEKVAANMSVALSKKGYKVFIVTMNDSVTYSFKGTLFNFGKIKHEHNRLKAFLKFKAFFKSQNFDAVIDHRVRDVFFKELLFSKLVFKRQPVVYCVHTHNLHYSFSYTNIPWLAKLPHAKHHKFVVVSKEIKKHLKEKLSLESTVVYNFFPNKIDVENESENINETYIIGVGRLNQVKQFDVLIKSYSQTSLPENNIKLFILGDGEEKENLQHLVSSLKLNKMISFLPFRDNPYGLIENAKALILSSMFEGFPMVLVEALSLKTPVVAFDCKSGPSEIIENGINGVLVENQNQEQLTFTLNKLLDNKFYEKLKSNVHIGLARFSEEKAVQEWINLLENQI